MDLTQRIADQVKRDEERAKLAGYEKAHGGLIPRDRETEEAQRSAAGWGPYRVSATAEDLSGASAMRADRFQRVTLQRLYVDCGAAVRRFAPKYKRDDADTLRSDALLLLTRWASHGGGLRKDGSRAPILDLGGKDGTPKRRDWLETVERADGRSETKLTRAAWAALHAAVKQAAETPAALALVEIHETETPTDGLDIAALVEKQRRETDAATRLPDNAAPEVIAETMDIPLDAARAIVARAYPHASTRDHAESWGISDQAARNALTRGAKALRARYPDTADGVCSLLDALDAAAETYRARCEARAILALIALRDGDGDETAAREAVADWMHLTRSLPTETRALLNAARTALARQGVGYGSQRAEQIARYVRLITRAEHKRAHRYAAIRSRGGSHLGAARDSASAAPLARFSRIERASSRARAELIGETRPIRYGDGYSGAVHVSGMLRRGERAPRIAQV